MAGLAGAIGLVCSAVLPTGASALPAQPLARQLAQPDVVHVVGNQLENAQGDVVQLMGVNRSGSEYACSQGWGIFDGPVDDASIQAIASWNTDIVRVPLNEDCWLGINGVNPQFGGAAYRKAIKGFVHRLEANGLLVDFDLHWNAPGAQLASGQQVMADEDHSPAFWRSMANTFKSDPAVLFELYNEPHDISWSCWLHGCTTSDGWQTAGMQQLVNTVRHTGATNVILVGGLGWSSDLSQWLKHEPNDPAGQLAATFHTLRLQRLQHPGVLGFHSREGRRAGARRRDGVRRDRLRRRLRDAVHELGGRAGCVVPRLDVGHLGLRQRSGSHHELRRDSDRIRPGRAAALPVSLSTAGGPAGQGSRRRSYTWYGSSRSVVWPSPTWPSAS